MTILSAAMLLVLVMDPLGNVPFFLAVLENVGERRRRRIVLRELLIALAVLGGFLLGGRHVLAVLHVSEPSLHIAGGIVLFLIAVRMIFSAVALDFAGEKGEEPLVVPLAVPAVAGPSAMATVLILVSQYPGRLAEWAAALLLAWVVVATTLLASSLLSRLLGRRGLLALQRLMGMVLTTLAVEMFLTGVRQFLGK